MKRERLLCLQKCNLPFNWIFVEFDYFKFPIKVYRIGREIIQVTSNRNVFTIRKDSASSYTVKVNWDGKEVKLPSESLHRTIKQSLNKFMLLCAI